MIRVLVVVILVMGPMSLSMAQGWQEQLDVYKSQGAKGFSAERGERLWQQKYLSAKTGKMHSCESCHGKKIEESGKHVKTGKVIDPIALSANQERFKDSKKIEKWFKRNCKWTLGRLCTPQEKGDFLTFLIK